MASEIPTSMLNPKKLIISDLKKILRALVIGGLFNITNILTKKESLRLLTFLVICNSEFVKKLKKVRIISIIKSLIDDTW
jgi:hypothetical protein